MNFRNTIIVVLGVALIAAIALLVNVIMPGPRRGDEPMIDAERAAELARQGKRLQIVSFMDGLIPLPPPSTKADPDPEVTEYAIVSGQITLGEAESSKISYSGREAQLSRYSSYRGFNTRGGYPQSTTASGRFNNVLIYDKRSGTAKKVFDTRLTVTGFTLVNDAATRVIAFVGTSDDTNKDGRLDFNDLQKLFLYTMADGQLHAVTNLAASPTDIVVIAGADYLVVEGVIDRNKDGIVSDIGDDPEPKLLYRVDLATFTAKPLLDPALVETLQATLDGAKPAAAKPVP